MRGAVEVQGGDCHWGLGPLTEQNLPQQGNVVRPRVIYRIKHRDNEAKMATERARNFQRESSDLRRKLSSIGSGGGGGGGTRVAVGSREPVPGRTPSIAEASGRGRVSW